MVTKVKKNVNAYSKLQAKQNHRQNLTGLLMSFLLHIRLKHMLKKTEFPVFHHLTMKNDTVFQFFQQNKKLALFPANPAIVTTL